MPFSGSTTEAPNWDLIKASAKVLPTPITSPVDFISGPKIVSTPGNLIKGKTASLTEKKSGVNSLVNFCSFKLIPAIAFAAILAKGFPIALETNGTVLDALGLTSKTKIFSPWIANCTFINPFTLSAFAIFLV